MTRQFALWVAMIGAIAVSGRAETWQRQPMSAAELAQGYRSDVVLAQPLEARQSTVDAEESADGTVVRRKFPRFSAVRAIAVRSGETPAAAIARLNATGRYRFVEIDRIRHSAQTTPNDPLFGQQWNLDNTGSNSPLSGPGAVGADIHAAAAWSIRTSAASVLVATVDTGVWQTHQDLVANLWTNPNAGLDGYGEDVHGIDSTGTFAAGNPTDDNGHGTHVAGIIGAVGNNGVDVSGVAWSAQIMALKYLDAAGFGGISDELVCLDYAIQKNVKIINASYGSTGSSEAEYLAVQALQNAGIIMVCAAGNSSQDNDLSPSYPCSYYLDNIVAVAASDNRDSPVYFSSYGSGIVEVAAPGYNILSLYNTSDTATAVLSGTSMATPAVTGCLALLEAQFPSDTYRQTINRLLRHVDQSSYFTGVVATGGRVDLAAALASAPNDNTPFNDDFAARSHMKGYTVTARGDNTGATTEGGEQAIGAGATGATLWYDWTAPASGNVTLTASNASTFPNLVGVFTGTSVDALTAVATGSASVGFAAQAGVTYEFAVDTVKGTAGFFVLQLSYGNSAQASATPLTGANVSVTDTTGYGTPRGSPKIGGRTPAYTVWYSWTAPATAHVQVSISSADFDPLIAVYTGASSSSLSLVGSGSGTTINSDNIAPVSGTTVGFVAAAGVTYSIEVGGATDATTELPYGQFTLSIANARWAVAASDAFDCSPAIAPNGSIYIGSDSGVFYALNPDGTTQWTYDTGSYFDTSAAAVGPDGTIYAPCENGELYAFTPTGAVKWTYTIPEAATQIIACSPAVAADGTIYFKDSDTTLFAISPNGTQKWTATVPGDSYVAPTIAPDGTVYIGSDDGNGGGMMYAFSSAGTLKWTFNAGNGVYTAAPIDSSGNLYFATLGGEVYALNSSGRQLWSYAATGGISSALTLGANGALYFGCYDHNLYAITAATGALQWKYLLGAQVRASSPAIDSNGVVYVGCYDGFIYAINSAGTLNQTLATGNYVRSSPAIFGTTLFVGSADCQVYAFDLGASAAGSTWPMYMGGARRLGLAASDPLEIIAEPVSSAALVTGSPLTLTVAAIGEGPLSYQWQLNGANIAGATNSTYVVLNPTAANDGAYAVVVSGPQGSVVSTPSVVGPLAMPAITTQPVSQTVRTGGTVNLTVGATGGNLSYQWYFDGAAIAGATSSNLLLTNVGANQGAAYGSYTVTAANPVGIVASGSAALTVVTSAQLLNLSASATVGSTGADYLVAGFAIGGGTKEILVRGVGPALAAFGVPGALAAPVLTFYNSAQTVLGTNSGWGNSPALAEAFIVTGAFTLPENSLDAALLESVAPGTYSAQVAGAGGTTGVALAEIYDDSTSAAGRLVNLSARANVGGGSGIASAGFVISGSTSETILIRGVGPTLSSFGLTGVLSSPSLTLFNPAQTALQSNSGWGDSTALSAVFAQVDAFGLTSPADAALIVTLPPGPYTAQLSGTGNASGVALVEIYEVR